MDLKPHTVISWTLCFTATVNDTTVSDLFNMIDLHMHTLLTNCFSLYEFTCKTNDCIFNIGLKPISKLATEEIHTDRVHQ